ncbi:MAG: hypothetical protein AAFX99_25140, partial [Myxococcota bacterium]
MNGLAEVLQPLLVMVVLFALLGTLVIARRRLVWDIPLIFVMVLIALGGLCGLLGQGEWADMAALVTLVTALALAEIPSLVQRQALLARIQGRYRHARRWSLVYWILRPGAKARLMARMALLLERVRSGTTTVREAMA